MAQMTLDELRTTLIACAGEDDSTDLSGDILDMAFDDLGYDSLARMESAARIEREYGIALPDEAVADAETPRALLDLVNGITAASA
ncbi:acyl carrier protein [Streptomyces sp. NBC_00878]|uniref:acyl carrier protein n=1 Tax=Streptomyces sp. NBC_00878 TaxID=2975854 RepID=UPI00225AED7B|nr:acyl carrier protein [Streptomyces sp. NBC_00878]MCX4906882.1 acyl carrier protein [Streptomyces sp. NBC_00878]